MRFWVRGGECSFLFPQRQNDRTRRPGVRGSSAEHQSDLSRLRVHVEGQPQDAGKVSMHVLRVRGQCRCRCCGECSRARAAPQSLWGARCCERSSSESTFPQEKCRPAAGTRRSDRCRPRRQRLSRESPSFRAVRMSTKRYAGIPWRISPVVEETIRWSSLVFFSLGVPQPLRGVP